MRRLEVLSTDQLVRAAIVLGAVCIFTLDLTSLYGVAGGGAFALVIALIGYQGRQMAITAAGLSAVFAVFGALLGVKAGVMAPSLLSGRIFGLLVIGALIAVLVHQLKLHTAVAGIDQEFAVYQQALQKIARRALAANKPLKERFEAVTELVSMALDADRVVIARVNETDNLFQLYEIWDRRLGTHTGDLPPPSCHRAEFQDLMENDFVSAAEDVRTSAVHRPSLDFYHERGIRAVLHAAALYRDQPIGSLVVMHGRPHHWTEREIAFAKSVANLVALLFAVNQCEQTLERLDFVCEGILVENQNGKIEYANRSARQLIGGDAKTLPFALDPLAANSDEHQLSNNGRDLEIHRHRLPDGGILMRVDDVTARNEALAENRRMQERLEQSSKLHAMGQLAAGVAHDFNNILSAIMGYVQVLSKVLESRPSEQVFTERILGVCKKGKGLTEEILAFARTSSVDRQEIDLTQVLEGSLDVVPGEASDTSKLLVELPHECLPVNGNGAQLMQLIQNLVINARHACEGIEGRITISAGHASRQELADLARQPGKRNERVLGAPSIAKDYCFLRVADNGHGIPPEIMDRIFEPFFTTKGRRHGSGLGLSVVHAVVNSHDGCCHVQSEAGRGTTFTIYIPLLAGMAAAMPEAKPIEAAAVQGREKVLIVDDNVELAEILKMGLQQLGYGVTVLSDPHEALAAIRQDPTAFDVLITDQVMPKMEGVDLIAVVKARHTGIKLVLCTGANLPGIEEKSLAAGADAFLRKPLEATEIALRIRTLLSKIEKAA